MAIYHLSHGYIGKGTQKQPHTAAAHSNYITRPSTATTVMGERMPTDWRAAAAWLKAQEDCDRINARVIDKIEVALPVELNPLQRAALVRDFAETLTEGRASWLAAFHDSPKDEHNPHAHIILRDRDATAGPGQGRRVMLTTERGTIDRIRQLWQEKTNQVLEQAGSSARIDHRTLTAQGIEREPQIHVGPKTLALTEKGVTPESRSAEVQRIDFTTGQRVAVTVDYPAIDQGRTRADYNAEIRARNAAKARAAGDLRQQIPAAPTMPTAEAEREPPARYGVSFDPEWTNRGGMVAQQRAANVWVQGTNRVRFGLPAGSASMKPPSIPLPKTFGAINASDIRPPVSFEQLRAENGWVGEYPCGPGLVRTDQLHHEERERLERLARERCERDGVAAHEAAGRQAQKGQQEKPNAALIEQQRAGDAFTRTVTKEAEPAKGDEARMSGKSLFATAAPPTQPKAAAETQRAGNPFTRGVTEKNLADLAASSRGQERGLER